MVQMVWEQEKVELKTSYTRNRREENSLEDENYETEFTSKNKGHVEQEYREWGIKRKQNV